MIITEERLLSALDVLQHGGEEAISLFLEICIRLHQTGHSDALRDWVIIAAPTLPEKERNEVMILLMRENLPPIVSRCGQSIGGQYPAPYVLEKASGED
jgi:hypothetical protein